MERNQILDTVFKFSEKTGKPVVFLSGDVHVAAAFKLFRRSAPNAQIYQLTSSGITYASTSTLLEFIVKEHGEIGDSKKRLKDYPTSFRLLNRVMAKNNFALINVTSHNQKVEIIWQVYGNTGEADEIMRLKPVILK